MKYRTTQKEIRANYKNVIRVGYCNLQYMLNFKTASAYTATRYGWGADIYEVSPDTVIVTGYAPFGTIKPDYNTIRDFEIRAEEIRHNNNYEDMPAELDKLIAEFVETVTKEAC